jgi:hypothetical protein
LTSEDHTHVKLLKKALWPFIRAGEWKLKKICIRGSEQSDSEEINESVKNPLMWLYCYPNLLQAESSVNRASIHWVLMLWVVIIIPFKLQMNTMKEGLVSLTHHKWVNWGRHGEVKQVTQGNPSSKWWRQIVHETILH